MRHPILTISTFAVLAACGGNDQPKPVQGTINSTSARSSVQSVHDAVASMSTNNASGAADAVMALTAAGQSVVIPGGAHELQPMGMVPRLPKHTTTESLTGSASCDATSCTFTDFGDDTPYGSYRINGTISNANNVVAFDLTYDITSENLTMHWELDGSVTVTDTLIDGMVHSHGSADATSTSGAVSVTWDVDVGFDHIGLDGAQCPTSGSLDATVSYSASGNGQNGSYAATGRVTFGPTCGEVTPG